MIEHFGMRLEPKSGNSIDILLPNGDKFNISSPNGWDMLLTRVGAEKDMRVDSLDYKGDWNRLGEGWMIRIDKSH